MSQVYTWAVGSYFQKYDANEVKKELDIIEKNDELTAEKVVNYARNKDTYINQMLEWNDSIAGEKYRQQQASSIIGGIRVKFIKDDNDEKDEKEEIEARVFVTTETEKRKSKFKNIFSLTEELDQYALELKSAYKELNSIKRKYKGIVEIQELLKDIPQD